jgi:hypothetical protein
MTAMPARLLSLVAALLTLTVAASGLTIAPSRAVALETGGQVALGSVAPATSATAIVPGAVGRSSLFVDATYDASLRISWGTRRISVDSTATIRNSSGGPIDRIELNTIAARLGSIQLHSVTVDGVPVAATRTDQTIVVPLGGILPVDATTQIRVRFHALLRSSLSGSNWLFTKANGIIDLYRWLPWVSRTIAFDRPNHGDPFETPTSRSVRVRITTSRKLVLATSGDRTAVSADGLTQTFAAMSCAFQAAAKAVGRSSGCATAMSSSPGGLQRADYKAAEQQRLQHDKTEPTARPVGGYCGNSEP